MIRALCLTRESRQTNSRAHEGKFKNKLLCVGKFANNRLDAIHCRFAFRFSI